MQSNKLTTNSPANLDNLLTATLVNILLSDLPELCITDTSKLTGTYWDSATLGA